MQSSNKSFTQGLDWLIFFGSVTGIISLCLPLALFPEKGGVILGRAFDFLTQQFGVFMSPAHHLPLPFCCIWPSADTATSALATVLQSSQP